MEILYQKLSSADNVDSLKKIPIVGVSKGRPKKEKRDPIGVEWARLNLSQRMSQAKKLDKDRKRKGFEVNSELPVEQEPSKKKFKANEELGKGILYILIIYGLLIWDVIENEIPTNPPSDKIEDSDIDFFEDSIDNMDIGMFDDQETVDLTDEHVLLFDDSADLPKYASFTAERDSKVKNEYSKQYSKTTRKFSKYDAFLTQVSDRIPKECYTCVVNVIGDGFCGFRALAYQIYGDEKEFWRVKREMRDTLLLNQDHYRKHLSRFIIVDELIETVCYGIEKEIGNLIISSEKNLSAASEYWFNSPDCAQLAADTYQAPLAVFSEKQHGNYGTTFLPLLNESKTVIPKKHRRKTPLLLQRVDQNHWVTLIMRKAIKMTWPLPMLSMYQEACKSMGLEANFKKSPWNKIMIFAAQDQHDNGKNSAK